MITFEELCSVDDILSAVQEKHKLTAGDPSLKIVGFQEDSILFCCFVEGADDGSMHTLFGRINVFSHVLDIIYDHPSPIIVLVASVNMDSTLLGKLPFHLF